MTHGRVISSRQEHLRFRGPIFVANSSCQVGYGNPKIGNRPADRDGGYPTKCGITYGEIDTRPMADLKFAKPTGKPRLLALPSGPLTTKFGGAPPKLRHETTGTFNKLRARICGRAGSGEVASSRRLFCPP
jgi:hypothetical protein